MTRCHSCQSLLCGCPDWKWAGVEAPRVNVTYGPQPVRTWEVVWPIRPFAQAQTGGATPRGRVPTTPHSGSL